MIEFGLAVAEAEAPRDPLMPVLRKIWVEGDSKESSEKQDKPAEAKPAEKPVEAPSIDEIDPSK